jgi:hypothetical protein
MPNLSGLLNRTLDPDSTALPVAIAWTLWVLSIAIFCAAWNALGNRVSILHVGLLITVAVILSPHIHLHDASLLAITAAICTVWRCGGGRSDWAVPAIALAAGSLLLTVASISPESRYDVFLLAALLLVTTPLMLDIRRETADLAAPERS